ncbi:MAG: hypothetical protein J6U23_01440 [Clostridiales bacterium]|nr:hypothetical protein [Clostridiales bacterium]
MRFNINGKKKAKAKDKAKDKAKVKAKVNDKEMIQHNASDPEPEKKQTAYKPNRKARAGKRALRNSIFAVVVAAFSLAVLVFVIYHLYDYIAAKPKFEFISTGRVEHTIGATALIVRDETVIPSKAKGELVTKATEGSRISKSQEIAMVVPDNMSSIVTNLRNTQSQVSEVQQELIMSGKAPGAQKVYDDVDEDILPIVDLLRQDAMNGNLSNTSSYESSLAVLIDKREKELTKIDFEDERLNLLRNDASSYENQLSKNAAIIKAVNPGIVSYKLDGWEEELSFDFLLSAEPSTIKDYISRSTGAITSDLAIEEDENVARISQNEEQYLAVILSGKDVKVEEFEVDSKHNINIASEGVTIDNCKVVRSVPCDDGLLVVFSTSRHVESLIGFRSVNIEIVINSTSGLRVQTTSLVKPDYDRGVATIYVNDDGFASEVDVIIKDYDREFAIIAPFGDASVPSSKTVIITNPTAVKPGDKVE